MVCCNNDKKATRIKKSVSTQFFFSKQLSCTKIIDRGSRGYWIRTCLFSLKTVVLYKLHYVYNLCCYI